MKDYSKLHERQIEELIEQNEALNYELKDIKKENKRLKNIEDMFISISKRLDEITTSFNNLTKLYELSMKENELLKAEIERIKNNNKKDSSNSSKPSSTNGSKIIPNNREKSNRKTGGQKGHKAHTLKAKDIDKLIKDKDNIKLVKKTINDLNKKYPKYIVDLVTNVLITENEECEIDKLNEVNYGDNIKSIVILLLTDNYMSIDGVVKFISAITNNVINLSKGTIVNWMNNFKDSLKTEINEIDNELLNGYYVNSDDSTIKINGKNSNQLCIANEYAVHLYASNSKSRKAWNDETVLSKYLGIIVKDGTKVFDDSINIKSQCGAHISRYLKAAYDFSSRKHKAPRNMNSFLNSLNRYRNTLIKNNISSFSADKILSYETRYDEIIRQWAMELSNVSNITYKDEINLYERMKGKDRKEILYFIYDFKIPFTNNNAEQAQRGIKIKQKVGKFRSFIGASNYCTTKSFILTLKKKGLSLINSIKNIINGNPVLSR